MLAIGDDRLVRRLALLRRHSSGRCESRGGCRAYQGTASSYLLEAFSGEVRLQLFVQLTMIGSRKIPTPPVRTVALIDDDTRILASLSKLLASGGYGARVYVGAQDFFSDGCSGLLCVITDLRMQPIDGMKVLERMIASKDGLPVIIITGSPEEHAEEYYMAAGALGFFQKPVDGDALLDLLDSIP